ncbi:MAG: hypothetical protein BZY73_05900 [SAR202 cluster bacterium Casp-Chloro-G3]|nr:MAG: hypothetical protein BZY73_05900 [SAR202 cluster bacterium Casp-Chloro-G3]
MGFFRGKIILRGRLQDLGQPPQGVGRVGQGPQRLSQGVAGVEAVGDEYRGVDRLALGWYTIIPETR